MYRTGRLQGSAIQLRHDRRGGPLLPDATVDAFRHEGMEYPMRAERFSNLIFYIFFSILLHE